MSVKPYQWGQEPRGLWWFQPCALFAGKLIQTCQSSRGYHSICKQSSVVNTLGWYNNAKGIFGEAGCFCWESLGKWHLEKVTKHKAMELGCLADWDQPFTWPYSLPCCSQHPLPCRCFTAPPCRQEVKVIWENVPGATGMWPEGQQPLGSLKIKVIEPSAGQFKTACSSLSSKRC